MGEFLYKCVYIMREFSEGVSGVFVKISLNFYFIQAIHSVVLIGIEQLTSVFFFLEPVIKFPFLLFSVK